MKNLGIAKPRHYPELSNWHLYIPLVVALVLQYVPIDNLFSMVVMFITIIAVSYLTIRRDQKQLSQLRLKTNTRWLSLLFPLYVILRNRETGGDKAPVYAVFIYIVLSVWITFSGMNRTIHQSMELTTCVKIIEYQLNASPRSPICQNVDLTREVETDKWSGYALLSDEATVPVTVWLNKGVSKVEAELTPGVITTINNRN